MAGGPWEQYAPAADVPPWEQYAKGAEPESPGVGDRIVKGLISGAKMHTDAYAGMLRGGRDIVDTGALLLAKGYDKLTGADKPSLSSLVTGPTGAAARVAAINAQGEADFEQETGGSGAGKFGRVFGNVAATAPVGGVLGAGAKALGMTRLGTALTTSGMSTGAPVAGNVLAKAADLGIRSAGGAITGGASAGLIDPASATTGAVVGGALPGVLKAAGAAGNALGGAVRGSGASPEVQALAARAKALGIDIPADRLTDSKPLNAVAAALNYVPGSGRAATESKMEQQLNRAASRLMGQDTPNITQSVRKAGDQLGKEFDRVLGGTTVRVDNQFLNELAAAESTATGELVASEFKPIAKQIDDLLAAGQSGAIDGQAAYNIKRTLDRLGNTNSPHAYHAREIRDALFGALDRSLGPTEAAAFAKTREQWSNMRALEKIAKNGAEGDISVARLANMRNIRNEPLQELADIAAQFVKPREGMHGAAQRAAAGGITFGLAGPQGLAAGMAGGRLANNALNSNTLRSMVLGQPVNPLARLSADDMAALVRTVPALTANPLNSER